MIKISAHFVLTIAMGLVLSMADAYAAKKKKPVVVLKPAIVVAPNFEFSQAVVERDGLLQIMNTMTCDSSLRSVCQSQCRAPACEWPEPLCRDCLGTGSEVMREIFSRLSIEYHATDSIDSDELIRTLVARTIKLTRKSPYDVYNSSTDPDLGSHLQLLCGSPDGLVGVMYDEDHRPTHATLVACNTPQGWRVRVLERKIEPKLLNP